MTAKWASSKPPVAIDHTSRQLAPASGDACHSLPLARRVWSLICDLMRPPKCAATAFMVPLVLAPPLARMEPACSSKSGCVRRATEVAFRGSRAAAWL